MSTTDAPPVADEWLIASTTGVSNVGIRNTDALTALRALPDASVHAIVTDPPYGLANTTPEQVTDTITRWTTGDREHVPAGRGFMGKEWDAFVPPPAVWDECLRVLVPGGHLLAFAGTRTVDLMGLSIRLAGFDIRDSITWLYGSGFPKSLDVGKAIDKAAGATREVTRYERVGIASGSNNAIGGPKPVVPLSDNPATPEAAAWHGWGTALKPASEPIVVARKPLDGTVAANVLAHGAGALNIDASRVTTTDKLGGGHSTGGQQMADGWHRPWMDDPAAVAANAARSRESVARSEELGRWPANALLDGAAADALDKQSGILTSGANPTRRGSDKFRDAYGEFQGQTECTPARGTDSGGASRFFPVFRYQAKATTKERPKVDGVAHPTVKPLALMRWLVKLVTPPGGTVLDPFSGSGTTAEAAVLEGFDAIVVELDPTYVPLIRERLARHGGVST